jgi:hypothetical protein
MITKTILFGCVCLTTIYGTYSAVARTTQEQSAQIVIDNDRVTASDITLVPGVPATLNKHGRDFVTLYLTDGTFRISGQDANSNVVAHRLGDATFTVGKSEQSVSLISTQPARIVSVELKDYPPILAANTSKYPDAFPRPGSTKLLENDRIVIWRNVWLPGITTPMHYHSREAVVLYLEDGSLKSTSPEGEAVFAHYKRGMTKFFKADRTHSEELASDKESAVIIELK